MEYIDVDLPKKTSPKAREGCIYRENVDAEIME
jgi:hypothetical protein